MERIEAMVHDIPIISVPCSYKFNWLPNRSFDIICHNRESWLVNKFDRKTDCVQCFTDGSNSNDSTGCAFVIYYGNQVVECIFPLGEMCTVFDSEVYAIMQAADVLESMALSSRRVRIFTDSMSALQAIFLWMGERESISPVLMFFAEKKKTFHSIELPLSNKTSNSISSCSFEARASIQKVFGRSASCPQPNGPLF